MKAYLYDPERKSIFKEEVECQKDPVESKRQGKDVWLLPGNATFEAPPEAEEGYAILFENGHWVKKHDYKGKTYYVAADGYYGTPKEMKDYGELPEGCSFNRPPMTLAETKEQKIGELSSAFGAWRSDGATLISSLGFEADADEKANADVNGLVIKGQPAVFMDAHNQAHELTLDQLKTLQSEIIDSASYGYQKKWAYRDAINNATTVEDLNAISIVFTPKDFSA